MCIVVSCDCFTGVFAGFAVFATIGFLSRELKERVEVYANSSGPGLAFITYPEAISHMPASPFFSIIFFLMLLALGLGSQVSVRRATGPSEPTVAFLPTDVLVRLDGRADHVYHRVVSSVSLETSARRHIHMHRLVSHQLAVRLSGEHRHGRIVRSTDSPVRFAGRDSSRAASISSNY
jgi:hypothetical protein